MLKAELDTELAIQKEIAKTQTDNRRTPLGPLHLTRVLVLINIFY